MGDVTNSAQQVVAPPPGSIVRVLARQLAQIPRGRVARVLGYRTSPAVLSARGQLQVEAQITHHVAVEEVRGRSEGTEPRLGLAIGLRISFFYLQYTPPSNKKVQPSGETLEISYFCRRGGFSFETENCHETALGEAFGADFWCKINSATSPIDLDRFRSDLDDPKIQKKSGRSRVSFLI